MKDGGRLAVSDIVLTKQIPKEKITLDSYGSCIAGANFVDDLEQMLAHSGFGEICITPKGESKKFLKDWSQDIEDFIVSADIKAVKRD